MTWLFRPKQQRDARVTELDQQARAGEISLVHKILELDRKRVDLNQLSEETLSNLHSDGARRV